MWQGSHGRGGEAWGGCRCAPTAKGARGAEKSYKLRLCYGPGDQFSAPGGTVNISKGSGNQFTEGTFSGAHSLVPIPCRETRRCLIKLDSSASRAQSRMGLEGVLSLHRR
ncbi:uncharacterized protein B0I36DRAFT_436204 [Microdochium trichocladiopsis]|uniref:NACHT-NTPase sigma domain-containing protein n=1 Tax=Microdochium trichocladiopsis TaxID=1682393 RepID=A0A9P8XRI2_9PEZI|nr:uncharacterized protein B0I36DRAFT_436204 [Microdochium trichocladiopsis]KAH7014078.1 hypothetical protein B0I36DRAFT_436204 [Microdochium trichocladiopsis]